MPAQQLLLLQKSHASFQPFYGYGERAAADLSAAASAIVSDAPAAISSPTAATPFFKSLAHETVPQLLLNAYL